MDLRNNYETVALMLMLMTSKTKRYVSHRPHQPPAVLT